MKKKNHLTREQRYQISALLHRGTSRQGQVSHQPWVETQQREAWLPSCVGAWNGRGAQGTPETSAQVYRSRLQADIAWPVRRTVLSGANCRPCAPWGEGNGQPYTREDKKNGGHLYTHLRHKLKHRKRPVGCACSIRDRVSIEERPAVVDERSRFGDWEIDTIVGKDNKGAIVTLTERKTGYLMMEKLPQGKNAKGLAETVIRMLTPYKKWVHTITSDNGTEFAEHKMIAKKLDARFFFCHPYSSWERGLNEYTNGLVRQYIPKGEPFEKYDNLYIRKVQYKINKRPREKLNFDCPKRLFFALLQWKVALVGLICDILYLDLFFEWICVYLQSHKGDKC